MCLKILKHPYESINSKRYKNLRAGCPIIIATAVPCPCLAMLSAAGILIGNTFKYGVIINSILPDLQSQNITTTPRLNISSLAKTEGTSIYYFSFNLLSLTTIASVAGKLPPYLFRAVMGYQLILLPILYAKRRQIMYILYQSSYLYYSVCFLVEQDCGTLSTTEYVGESNSAALSLG